MTEEPPTGRVTAALGAVKGLSLNNVLVIALLAIIAIPLYLVYKALNDTAILDRLMSTYREYGDQQSGCTLREAKSRGGPDFFSVSTGFAFHGQDKWYVAVSLNHKPSDEEVVSHCATLKLIADSMSPPRF